MSLIIASHYKDSINILSDTKLTYSVDKPESLKENHYDMGVVKVKFITKNIVVAWAGELLYAQKAYKAIAKLTDLDEICNELLSIHIKSGESYDEPRTDFIVAFNSENEKELISIKDKKITRKVEKAFIGDSDAYSEYRQSIDSGENIAERNYFELVIAESDEDSTNDSFINRRVFIYIINSEKYNTVGGILIHLQSVDNTFKFLNYVDNINFREQRILVPNEWQDIDLGNTQTGACCTIVFQSRENCVAVHIHEANLGIIFEEDDELIMSAKYYKNNNIIRFTRFVKNKYPSLKLLLHKGVGIRTYLEELGSNLNNSNQRYNSQEHANDDLKNVKWMLLEQAKKVNGTVVELEDLKKWELLGAEWCEYYLHYLFYDSIYNDNIGNYDGLIKDSRLILTLSCALISLLVTLAGEFFDTKEPKELFKYIDKINEKKYIIASIINNTSIILTKNNCNDYNLMNQYSSLYNYLKTKKLVLTKVN